MSFFPNLFEAIVNGNAAECCRQVRGLLAEDIDPVMIVEHSMVPAMAEVGERFARCEYYVPELLISARAMKAGMEILKPLLAEANIAPAGHVVLGTVKGDLHDLGKSLVGTMLQGGGFEVTDLGADVAPERFVEAVRRLRPDIVGFSALLTTTMPMMKVNIERLDEAGLRSSVKVMVGGAPLTATFAQRVGADGYAPNAPKAVELARQWVAVKAPGAAA